MAIETPANLAEFIIQIESYNANIDIDMVRRAYLMAEKAHAEQYRSSGHPYIEHCIQVAFTLAELHMDSATITAGMIHDVVEDTDVSLETVRAEFGDEVADLVDGVTKIGQQEYVRRDEAQAETFRKMILASARDLRVILVKLADRLHNMRTLDALPRERQLSIAQETLEIYTPLAHRLGIWELKWQLEDLSFRYLLPKEYQQIASLVDAKRTQREKFIARAIELLKKEFEKVGLVADISGRPKHIYSIHQKMKKYAAIGKHFDEIYDLLAMRVLVGNLAECYSAVGIIHSLWHPLPETFDDYISNPKPNGYQALHTAVMCLGTTPLEIQILTREMYHVAEYGVAAHWRYKEGSKTDMMFEDRVAWLRQLIEWHRELAGAEEFLESVKTDIFIDQVFVYTPKGEIKDLPKGATPLDFAYRVHTEVGHRCIGAKVNGKLVPLNYQLNNGDVVEIMSAKGEKGPSRDWLNPHLGYLKTSHAQEKVRQWFRRQERAENIERGRALLEKEMRHLGLKPTEREELARLFEYDNVDDFLAAIGYGGVSTHQIAVKLSTQPPTQAKAEVAPPPTPEATIRVLGMGNLVTNLARCCRPLPGDPIIGYVTRSRGVTIHRQDCYNVVNEEEKERLVAAEWGRTDSLYPVSIQVEAWDRVGLIRDVTTIMAEEGVNIGSVNLTHHDDHSVTLYFTFQTRDLAQLSRLMGKIDGIRGVTGVSRVGDEATAKPKSST